MTPQSVGVPGTSFVLGKHSGRHALGQRCEQLGFRLDRRELDLVYRQFLVLADNTKTVDDSYLLEIIGNIRRGDTSADVAGTAAMVIPSKAYESGFGAAAARGMYKHETEQQEDYLWGV